MGGAVCGFLRRLTRAGSHFLQGLTISDGHFPCCLTLPDGLGLKLSAAAAAVFCVLLSGCAQLGQTTHTAAGLQAIEEKSYEEALTQFEQALEAGEPAKGVYRGQGIALMGQLDYEGAAQAFTQSLASGSGVPGETDFDVNFYLAACFVKLGQPDEAKKAYDAILALRPREAAAYELRGAVEASQGSFEAADDDFRAAIALEPTNYDRMIEMMETMSRYGQKEMGQAYLSEALTAHGEGMSNYDKGRLSYYLEDYDTARACLEKARSDSDYQATTLLGKTYEALGDYNYALSVYQAFLSGDQSHPEIYNQMGLCQMAMGSYQDALNSFQTGMKLPDNAALQSLSFNEIVAYEHLGDFRKAAVLMETYLENYPDDEKAQREDVFLGTRG